MRKSPLFLFLLTTSTQSRCRINNLLRPKQLNNHHHESSSRKIFSTTVVVKLVVSHKEQLCWPFGTIRSCGAPGATVQFRDDKSYFEAKAAWHVARAEYNRYQAVYHETAAKRHREWLQSDIGTAAKLKEEEAKEPSIEELIAQAQAAIEEKKAAVS
ncbi:hypothetical protein FGSG_03253 [Fusarium graminearum PH-1]|uniref:hypothetical protein n=1 Tax=Gibberella zeae (strain ATCC MYA-4620 / CBS 123657 / FGSC 9075 / NRRL 31084 / PH-1) TaxID=229533 RepID=UPI00021F147C|nr:hypothetical protein FGSG_03253 [Fusarium graminearum PH-1]ESU09999.1 hypothetical protein FGSG_03253 [Fusarium graminearum PH-1]|eukprot:XP_011322498.1 hypothetical protein FGSG_03253 [Fusarium graminearum PH-1]